MQSHFIHCSSYFPEGQERSPPSQTRAGHQLFSKLQKMPNPLGLFSMTQMQSNFVPKAETASSSNCFEARKAAVATTKTNHYFSITVAFMCHMHAVHKSSRRRLFKFTTANASYVPPIPNVCLSLSLLRHHRLPTITFPIMMNFDLVY